MKDIIAHLDMDCFFCACEQKRDKWLIGKPVIVGSTGMRGVVSAANYEARKYGVYSATPISKARMLCPRAVFLPVDHDFYSKESARIMSLLKGFADETIQVSIDEAYLILTDFSSRFMDLHGMAKHIQKYILEETRLSCSIGVANSRIVAKIASDFKKPGGITIVSDQKEFLAPLDIKKMPGIGKVTSESYRRHGINTIGELAKKDRFSIIDNFGMHGVFFQKIALGEDVREGWWNDERKSISRETTFMEDTDDVSLLEEELMRLCDEMHDDNLMFRNVSIKVRYAGFETITRAAGLKTPSSGVDAMKEWALHLLHGVDLSKKVRLIGVKLSNLSEDRYKQTTIPDFIG